MSFAWETTEDDVLTVLVRHGIDASDERLSELHDSLNHDEIEQNVLRCSDMDEQTDSMLSDIEDQLMKDGVIPKGVKRFN